MHEVLPGQTGCTRGASLSTFCPKVVQCNAEKGKEEERRKRSTRMMTRMRMMMMICTTHHRTTTMRAKLTPSSNPPKGSSRKLTGRVTHK